MQASELFCKYLGGLCLSMELSYSPAGTVSFIYFWVRRSQTCWARWNCQQVKLLTFTSQTQTRRGLWFSARGGLFLLSACLYLGWTMGLLQKTHCFLIQLWCRVPTQRATHKTEEYTSEKMVLSHLFLQHNAKIEIIQFGSNKDGILYCVLASEKP